MDNQTHGLYQNYRISHGDGRPVEPTFEGFVLRLDQGGDRTHVAACREAMLTYGVAIQRKQPQLAIDIFKRWGPAQPEGWEHRYFKQRPDTEHYLISQVVAEVCAGRGVWLLLDNDRAARDMEVDIRTQLDAALGSKQARQAMQQRVDVTALDPRHLRGLGSARLQGVNTILIDNPKNSALFRREGDPRLLLNKRLFMISLPPIRLVSVETIGN